MIATEPFIAFSTVRCPNDGMQLHVKRSSSRTCAFGNFRLSTMAHEDEVCEYILVDLGELSRTRFGTAVTDATFLESEGSVRIHVDTGVIEKQFDCKRTNPVGTQVLYDDTGRVIGFTREVYRVAAPSDRAL